MGKMASLLEQMCQQNPKVDKSSQGERPTGIKRMSTADHDAHESELELDSETSTIRSRGKRRSDVAKQVMMKSVLIYAGDSADEAADQKPWFRLVTCLPDFGRQTNSVIRVGRERGKNVLTA